MFMRSYVVSAAVIAAGVLLMAPSVASANLLANPSFEDFHDNGGPRPDVWTYFSNSYSEAMGFARTGERVEKFYGDWSAPWNASGVYQEFPSAEGDIWEIDCFAYHWSGDPLTEDADPGLNNRLVMKIEYQDSGGGVLGIDEVTIVDPYTAQDTWIDVPALQGTAPANTAQVLAVWVFLQPNYQGGSAWIDDASFVLVPEPTTLGLFGLGGLALLRRRR